MEFLPEKRPENGHEGLAAQWLREEAAGQPAWWQKVASHGTPIVEPHDDSHVKMTWLWRDPAGDERHSPICRVYADINGITDHHSTSPSSLTRLPGTDVWYGAAVIDRRWRGSYSLIPITERDLPPVFSGDDTLRDRQQRAWWVSLFPLAIADPLNRLSLGPSHRPRPVSLAQGPDADDQSAWQAVDRPLDEARLQLFQWRSERLDNQRRVWLYASGDAAVKANRPLVLLLDGQNWIERHALLPVIEHETAKGRLPPACWLLIDAIDGEHRENELPCNAAFWQAIIEELLPQAQKREAFSEEGARTVVAGQSYGGLAALYAGMHWPERFGRVLSQSGSFWWPTVQFVTQFEKRHELEEGWLIRQVRQRDAAAPTLTVIQQAGDREADIEFVNRQMHQALTAAGHRAEYRVFSGGHDALCWRGGLVDGVRQLLSAME